MWPMAAMASAAALSTLENSPTSSANPLTVTPCAAASSAAAASAESSVREVMTRSAPAEARALAISRPKCRAPPVMNATLPLRSNAPIPERAAAGAGLGLGSLATRWAATRRSRWVGRVDMVVDSSRL